jgi:excisionase family DNA binding protein
MTTTNTPKSDLLTFAEVARRLGVDVNTIRRNVRADQIPVVRKGSKVRIPAAWVDDPRGWLDDTPLIPPGAESSRTGRTIPTCRIG